MSLEIGAEAFNHAVFFFTLYALGVLPFLMPLAVLLMEPVATIRHKIVLALTLAGFALFVWVGYGVLAVPTGARAEGHSIVYDNPVAHQAWVGAARAVVLCGGSLPPRITSCAGLACSTWWASRRCRS